MRPTIVAPRRPGQSSGNSVTARRWVRRLTELGHHPTIVWHDEGVPAPTLPAGTDAVLVIHARRCADSVVGAVDAGLPVAVLLAGTDLYVDLPDSEEARRSLDLADRIVVLQPAALDRLAGIDPSWAAKASVLHQSVDLPDGLVATADPNEWRVVVLAHLREVKDPLLAARAARQLPTSSAVVVDHAGAAHDDLWQQQAIAEQAANPRYRWHRELDRAGALGLLARARVLACTSRYEGGANVVSEALALGVAVVGTRIEGNTGLLGDDHPGLVPAGDVAALAALLHDLETDESAWETLRQRSIARAWMADPATERADLASVLDRLD